MTKHEYLDFERKVQELLRYDHTYETQTMCPLCGANALKVLITRAQRIWARGLCQRCRACTGGAVNDLFKRAERGVLLWEARDLTPKSGARCPLCGENALVVAIDDRAVWVRCGACKRKAKSRIETYIDSRSSSSRLVLDTSNEILDWAIYTALRDARIPDEEEKI